jgi:signal transduction histidine kinase
VPISFLNPKASGAGPKQELSARDAVLLPLDRELQERTDWFIRVRWVAGSATLAGTGVLSAFSGFDLPVRSLWLVAGAVLSYNLALYVFRETTTSAPARLRRLIHLQIALDWIALICTVYLTGGIGSPVSLTFVFHLIIAAILLSRSACYLLAAAASFLLGALAFLTGAGVVEPFGRFPWSRAADAIYIWCGLTVFFFIITYLSTSITARLREKELELSGSERALDLAYRELGLLYDIGQVVNSTLDINEVLSLIAENATRLLHAKACFLRLLDRSGRRLHVGAWYGLSQAYINKGPVEIDKSLVDSEVLKGGTTQVLEVADDPGFQYREEARREGLRSMLSCAITAKNRTLGVIRVYTSEPHVFGEQEQKLLLNLANLGAVAIQNAHSYSDLVALDEERVWFARTTHHQLRAPLAAAQGALEALPFAGALNETQEDLIGRARRRIQDSCEMIRDLLDLAAAQRLEDAVPAGPVRFDESLRRVLETAREQARMKNLRFVEEWSDAGDCLLQVQPVDLERIFSNLLNNALKYTRCGKVVFGARHTGGWLEAWVEDTGIGIGHEDLDRVFKGFYRTAAAKASGEVGTGLGLSIVRHTVERVGGSLSVQSEAGQGTRFDVRLPLAATASDPRA